MIATETAKSVLMVLLGLSVLWMVILIIKNDAQSLVRAIIVTVLVGAAFYYVNQTKLETLSFKAVKEDLFPQRYRSYPYQKVDSTVGGISQTTYIFPDPGPKLTLEIEEGGRYLTIKNLDQLNRVLADLGLPPVKSARRELASITGSRLDVNLYRWDDYDLGELTVERGICRITDSAQTYPCISTITLRRR